MFSHEGIEGKAVKNLLLFASSFANKEYFFIHTTEDELEEESGEEISEEQAIAESKEVQLPSAVTQTEVYPLMLQV